MAELPGLEAGLLSRLIAEAERRCEGREPAHDFGHVRRVAATAAVLSAAEGASPAVVVTAAWLHELWNFPKGHPESHRSGDVCAEHARELLVAEGCPGALVEPIAACIRDHAFSKGALPPTLEGRVLQDADRLDSIGAIGVARCFATTAEMKRPFYDPGDPFCRARAPDDKAFGLDHFYRKLLKIQGGLHTATARALGAERSRFLERFLEQLEAELLGAK